MLSNVVANKCGGGSSKEGPVLGAQISVGTALEGNGNFFSQIMVSSQELGLQACTCPHLLLSGLA